MRAWDQQHLGMEVLVAFPGLWRWPKVSRSTQTLSSPLSSACLHLPCSCLYVRKPDPSQPYGGRHHLCPPFDLSEPFPLTLTFCELTPALLFLSRHWPPRLIYSSVSVFSKTVVWIRITQDRPAASSTWAWDLKIYVFNPVAGFLAEMVLNFGSFRYYCLYCLGIIYSNDIDLYVS